MRNSRPAHRARGMTLLEIMVALAIFAIAGLTLMESSSSHIRNLSHLEQKTISGWIANDTLNELKLAGTWPEFTVVKNKVEMAGQDWDVEYRGIKTVDDNMRALEVVVLQDGSILARLQTYVLRPQ